MCSKGDLILGGQLSVVKKTLCLKRESYAWGQHSIAIELFSLQLIAVSGGQGNITLFPSVEFFFIGAFPFVPRCKQEESKK